MPHQLRVVAAVAVVSGLTAAGAVFVEERLGVALKPMGLSALQDLRRTR